MKQYTSKKNFIAAILSLFLFTALLALPSLLAAQEASGDDTDMTAFWDKIKADKKQVVAENMSFTDEEAKGFWPIYDDYQKELQVQNDRLKKAIESYAEAFNGNTLTDELAKKLIDESIDIEEVEAKMRKNYAAKLAKVLPGKKVARYLQIENKVRALVRFELAAGIPLVD